jgi:hypothetical protein
MSIAEFGDVVQPALLARAVEFERGWDGRQIEESKDGAEVV